MMKSIKSLVIFTLISTACFSQSKEKKYNKNSFVTQNRDTLFLANTAIGYSIKNIWDVDMTCTNRPVIIFKDSLWIEDRNKRIGFEKVN